ncbi:MAG: DNA-directed RNA polymerase subunit alpha [Chlamydiota bacterium]|nr:DNA-directed RNA polymerase subunit alpha [Chlamydiota bacterium]
MSVKYGKFELPNKIKLEESSASKTFGRFIAEPFERGFGHTIGNSMRRMMLTSLEAPAIISIRIEGVEHEYRSIDGIIEDMTNIVLNIKGALLRKLPMTEEANSKEQRILTSVIEVTQHDLDTNEGQYVVTLGDIVQDGIFEVVNPELPLFTVTAPTKRQVDLRVGFGRGYIPSERHVVLDKTSDEILIDTAFSPVRTVSYHVENTRVGQDTDFDKLVLEVETDGRVTPSEAVSFASQIALKHFNVFEELQEHVLDYEEERGDSDSDSDELIEKLVLRIDEIELSVRSTNCLSGANIETIAELVIIPERRMLEFRNFGKKSLNEIKAKLHDMNMYLGMDLSKFGITIDNVKERIKELSEKRQEMKNKQELNTV